MDPCLSSRFHSLCSHVGLCVQDVSILHAAPHQLDSLQMNSCEALAGREVMIRGRRLQSVSPSAPPHAAVLSRSERSYIRGAAGVMKTFI